MTVGVARRIFEFKDPLQSCECSRGLPSGWHQKDGPFTEVWFEDYGYWIYEGIRERDRRSE
jgi:hypothetical protein